MIKPPIYDRPVRPPIPAAPPNIPYQVILADPPWATYGESRAEFPNMRLEDIAAIPVRKWLASDAVVLLWVPNWQLPKGLFVLEAWGVKYRTIGFVWVKTNGKRSLISGTGFWTRPGVEICLLGSCGSPIKTKTPGARSAKVNQVVLGPRQQFARKPGIHEQIESMLGGPYLEMFARRKQKGWDVWGNEVN
jgi:N6-adenosine-specific RNA methylase IME4